MKKTISVYFSGTGFSINSQEYLAASLFNTTEENEQQIKIGFDGCGVLYPLSGTLFGSGLDEQCDKAIQRIIQEIANGNEITLNIYGHSRGAIGAIMLAQQLSSVDPAKLSINMALLDPVPGNLITPSSLDPFKISLANKAMDLTDCKPLKKVLALYPHIPLPSIMFHAPLFVTYPKGIELEEDVIAGCHAQAENLFDSASQISMLRVEEFLIKNGTRLNSSPDYSDTKKLNDAYIYLYERELNKLNKNGTSTTRDAHSAKGLYINTKTGAQYFNEHHKRLAGGAKDAAVALSIEPAYGPLALLKRATSTYPFASQIIIWSILSTAVASLLFFTGGLAAIPYVAVVSAKMGVFSIFAAAPIVGGALAALWYGAIKPVSLWAINRILYPMYSVREISVKSTVTTKGSSDLLLHFLSDKEVSKQAPPENAPYHGKGLFDSNSSANTNTPLSDNAFAP